MATVVMPYVPRAWAKRLHASLYRWAVLILHRRAGKTTAVINHHQRAALMDDWERKRLRFLKPTLSEADLDTLIHPPGGRHYGHVMPLRNQAKLTVWDALKFYARPIPGVEFNEADLMVRYPNGNKVQLFGADNPEALRGPGFSGLSFDEFSQHPGNLFSEVLSKSLADHLGYAVFAGTIKGKDQLHRTYERAKDDPDWFALWQDADTSLATEDDATIALLRQAMDDDLRLIAKGLMMQAEYDQEWFLSPEAAIKGAWFGAEIAAATKAGRICTVPHDPALPVDTDWDIGVDDSNGNLVQSKHEKRRGPSDRLQRGQGRRAASLRAGAARARADVWLCVRAALGTARHSGPRLRDEQESARGGEGARPEV